MWCSDYRARERRDRVQSGSALGERRPARVLCGQGAARAFGRRATTRRAGPRARARPEARAARRAVFRAGRRIATRDAASGGRRAGGRGRDRIAGDARSVRGAVDGHGGRGVARRRVGAGRAAGGIVSASRRRGAGAIRRRGRPAARRRVRGFCGLRVGAIAARAARTPTGRSKSWCGPSRSGSSRSPASARSRRRFWRSPISATTPASRCRWKRTRRRCRVRVAGHMAPQPGTEAWLSVEGVVMAYPRSPPLVETSLRSRAENRRQTSNAPITATN